VVHSDGQRKISAVQSEQMRIQPQLLQPLTLLLLLLALLLKSLLL
jgi:hypothetical protein